MKVAILLLVFCMASCSSVSEKQKLYGYIKNGECSQSISHLYVVRFIKTEGQLMEALKEGAPGKENVGKFIDMLVSAKSSSGGVYAEITSTEKAWKGLYGAWGFGVVKDNCIVAFLSLLAS